MKTKNTGIRRWLRAVPVTMLVGSAVICAWLATTAA